MKDLPRLGDPSFRKGDGSDNSVNGKELAELKVYPVELRGISHLLGDPSLHSG